MNYNKGFIQPEPDDRDYIFGGVSKLSGEPLTDGHWLKYIPETEIQKNDWIDSFNCTAFGTSNVLEILFTKVFNETRNFSDRFIGIIAGTLPPGNSPKVVINAIKKQGLVNEESLPFLRIKTIQEYYSPNPPTWILTNEAEKFLIEYGVGYEKVVNPTIENLKAALKFSPLGVAVKAWFEKDGLYYFPPELDYGHWTAIIDYVDGQYWIIFDSYPDSNGSFIRKIGWNEKFGYTLRYWLGPGQKEQVSILSKIVELLTKLATLLGFPPEQKQIEPVIVPDSEPVIPPPATPKYEWDTYEKARHSARTIMDEYGINWNDKNLLCAVIMAESGFDPNAIGSVNRNGTRDWGICMFNDGKNKDGIPYWIGQGATFLSTDEVLKFPEKSVRVMVKQFKVGNLKYWSAFVNGSYKKYL